MICMVKMMRKIYKIWIKHFSQKQINEIIHIKEIKESK